MPNQDIHKIIGEALETSRKSYGFSRQDLADLWEVSYQQIQKYENGTNRLTIDKFLHMHDALCLPIEPFFEYIRQPDIRTIQPKGEYALFKKLQSMKNTPLQEKIYNALDILISE